MLLNHSELSKLARYLLFASLACAWLVPDSWSENQPAEKGRSLLSAAEAHLRRENLKEAEKALWALLSDDPRHEQALTMLGRVRMKQRREAEAVALFRRVLQLNPRSALAAKSLAAGLAIQGKSDEAVEEYRLAAQLDPLDSSVKVELARLYLERKEFAEALSTLDSVPAGRLPAAAIPVRSASLLGLGRRSEAIALTRHARRSPEVALGLAEVFLEAELPDQVLSLLDSVPLSQRYAARVQYLRGCAFRKKRDLASALASFRRALAANPKSPGTLLAMAEISFVQNRPGEAMELQERARSLNPDSLTVLRQIVVQAMAAGQPTAATRAAAYLQQKSSELEDKYMVAAVMLETGDNDPAIRLLDEYVSQRPQDSRAWLGLGIAYRRQQRFPDAHNALERALALNPRLAEAQYELGVLAVRQGDSEEAIKHFERAAEAQPQHAKALLDLGTVYLQAGMLEKAQSALLRAQAANPSEPETEYQLSLLSNRLGRSDEAHRHLQRFQQLKREGGRDRQAGRTQASEPR